MNIVNCFSILKRGGLLRHSHSHKKKEINKIEYSKIQVRLLTWQNLFLGVFSKTFSMLFWRVIFLLFEYFILLSFLKLVPFPPWDYLFREWALLLGRVELLIVVQCPHSPKHSQQICVAFHRIFAIKVKLNWTVFWKWGLQKYSSWKHSKAKMYQRHWQSSRFFLSMIIWL